MERAKLAIRQEPNGTVAMYAQTLHWCTDDDGLGLLHMIHKSALRTLEREYILRVAYELCECKSVWGQVIEGLLALNPSLALQKDKRCQQTPLVYFAHALNHCRNWDRDWWAGKPILGALVGSASVDAVMEAMEISCVRGHVVVVKLMREASSLGEWGCQKVFERALEKTWIGSSSDVAQCLLALVDWGWAEIAVGHALKHDREDVVRALAELSRDHPEKMVLELPLISWLHKSRFQDDDEWRSRTLYYCNMLLDHGADPDGPFEWGPRLTEESVPLIIAISEEMPAVIELLLGKGARSDSASYRKLGFATPLEQAVQENRPTSLRCLLAKGFDYADCRISDFDFKEVERNGYEALGVLAEAGYDPRSHGPPVVHISKLLDLAMKEGRRDDAMVFCRLLYNADMMPCVGASEGTETEW